MKHMFCDKCGSIAYYDLYFQRYICSRCLHSLMEDFDVESRKLFRDEMIKELVKHQVCLPMARYYAECNDTIYCEYPDYCWHYGPHNSALQVLEFMDEWRKDLESKTQEQEELEKIVESLNTISEINPVPPEDVGKAFRLLIESKIEI